MLFFFVGDIYSKVVVCTKLGVLVVGSVRPVKLNN